MNIRVAFVIPVLFSGVVAMCVVQLAFPDADPNSRRFAVGVLATMTALLAGFVFAEVLGIARRIDRLPAEFRSLAWGDRDGPLPSAERRDEVGELIRGLSTLAGEVSDVLRSKAEVEKLALTDPLTGLPNRRGLFGFFTKLTDDTGALYLEAPFGVMHVDFDHFKAINDSLGHDAGDYVLQEAARRMAGALRDTDLLARLGGDEFVVVVPDIGGEARLEAVARHLIEQFTAPILYGETTFQLGISIGVVLVGRDSRVVDPSRLLIHSDAALCHAKAAGRNRHAVFTPSMAHDLARQQEQAEAIRQGLLEESFRPWFQPVVDRASGAVTALEVLARWEDPERGIVLPDNFLTIVETHNMAEDLGMQVMEQAFRIMAEWRREGIAVPLVHFNMSRAQMLAPSVVDRISWLLDEAGLDPGEIAVEISEVNCTGRSAEMVFANLRRLAGIGVATVLDDFGAVSGGLNAVTRLGATKVKSALSLTDQLRRDGSVQNTDLLRCLLRVGDLLGVGVVAKGVETDEQADLLAVLGFTEMQGNLLAPPMDAAAMQAWLATRPAPRLSAPEGEAKRQA